MSSTKKRRASSLRSAPLARKRPSAMKDFKEYILERVVVRLSLIVGEAGEVSVQKTLFDAFQSQRSTSFIPSFFSFLKRLLAALRRSDERHSKNVTDALRIVDEALSVSAVLSSLQ